ncbi:MAG: nitroreductase family protein [Desulfobacterales bacterium]
MLKSLISKTRSYRRFYQDTPVDMDTLRELVDLARHSASDANLQPLKYVLCVDKKTNPLIFETLGWAAYLKDWPGPVEGERPAAYIVILQDTQISNKPFLDHGIAAQYILLGATEKNLSGCMIATINRNRLRKSLAIEDRYDILLVVAIGKPKEVVTIEYIDSTGDIKYWRDDEQVHHVPKRRLEDLVLKEYA